MGECVRKWIVPAVLVVALVIGANSGRDDDVERGHDDEIAATTPTTETTARQARSDRQTADPALIVVDVRDGDTVDLSDGRRVHVLGIDAPEKGECGFEEAREFARATLLDEEVTVEADPTQDAVDRRGRSLLYVSRWGIDYSHAALSAGWARYVVLGGKPVQKAKTLRIAEDVAKALKLGIWGDTCAPPTTAPSTTAPPTTSHRPRPPAESNRDADVRRTVPPSAAAPGREARPTPRPRPLPEPPSVTEPQERACHPSYVPCVPNSVRDLDCKDVGHHVTVVGPDEYRLDDDNDGRGCEAYPAA